MILYPWSIVCRLFPKTRRLKLFQIVPDLAAEWTEKKWRRNRLFAVRNIRKRFLHMNKQRQFFFFLKMKTVTFLFLLLGHCNDKSKWFFWWWLVFMEFVFNVFFSSFFLPHVKWFHFAKCVLEPWGFFFSNMVVGKKVLPTAYFLCL